VKKSLVGLFGLVSLVAGLAVSGCGGSSGANTGPAIASCNAYCDSYISAACASPIYTTAAECKSGECTIPSGVKQGCADATKTYYDCRKTQADICADNGCDTQAAALLPACQ